MFWRPWSPDIEGFLHTTLMNGNELPLALNYLLVSLTRPESSAHTEQREHDAAESAIERCTRA